MARDFRVWIPPLLYGAGMPALSWEEGIEERRAGIEEEGKLEERGAEPSHAPGGPIACSGKRKRY